MKTVLIDLENRIIQPDGKLCLGEQVKFILNGIESAGIVIRSGSVTYIMTGAFSGEITVLLDSNAMRRLYKYASETESRNFVMDVVRNGNTMFSNYIRLYNRKENGQSNSNQTSEGITDCPDDGNVYLRKYGQWVASSCSITVNLIGTDSGEWYINGGAAHQSGETIRIEPGTYTITFKSIDGIITPASKTVTVALGDAVTLVGDYQSLIYYGYIQNENVYSVAQITGSMITGQSVFSANTGVIQVSVNAPAGSVIFAMIPSGSGLTVKKDDGVGGKTEFNLNNGTTGTGANGMPITCNGLDYLIYGEFNLVNAETIIYVE